MSSSDFCLYENEICQNCGEIFALNLKSRFHFGSYKIHNVLVALTMYYDKVRLFIPVKRVFISSTFAP